MSIEAAILSGTLFLNWGGKGGDKLWIKYLRYEFHAILGGRSARLGLSFILLLFNIENLVLRARSAFNGFAHEGGFRFSAGGGSGFSRDGSFKCDHSGSAFSLFLPDT
jgi:hypothetical protein